MKNVIAAFLLLLSSCVYDYDPGQTNVWEENRLVVNTILSPSQTIRVWLGAARRTEAGFVYEPVRGARVKLTEDGGALYDGVCGDTVLAVDYRPKENLAYAIEVSLDGYETVRAETVIPEAVTCRLKSVRKGKEWQELPVVYLYDFAGYGGDGQEAVYISEYLRMAADTLAEIPELYSKNALIDRMNRMLGSQIPDEEVGSLFYENFIRIKKLNIPRMDTLVFSGAPGFGGEENLFVKVITAGNDYDRYVRTLYEQAFNDVSAGSDLVLGVGYTPVHVYGNVRGGLGIFAGMNETDYAVE
jgi:hypothetical protein